MVRVYITKFDRCNDAAADCSLEPSRQVGVVVEDLRSFDGDRACAGIPAAIRLQHA
jgi:hypothetical protein